MDISLKKAKDLSLRPFTHSGCKGIFSYSFLRVTEGFSFAALTQLSRGSVLLVMFACFLVEPQ